MRILLTWTLIYLFTASNAFGWGFVYVQPGEEAPAGGSFGVGDLASERFTGTGTDETWATVEVQGGATWDEDASTITDTGFDGNHLTATAVAGGNAVKSHTLASGVSDLYFRFYYNCSAEGYTGTEEEIFTINGDVFRILIRDVAGALELYMDFGSGGTGWTGDLPSYTDYDLGDTVKIEGEFIEDGASDTIEIKIDGVVVGNVTGAFWAASALDVFEMGIQYDSSNGSTNHFDTFDVDASDYLTDS